MHLAGSRCHHGMKNLHATGILFAHTCNFLSKDYCGNSSHDHAHLGSFLTIRPSDSSNITALLLMKVCHNVATEPALQLLSGEAFSHLTANTDAEARADIRARGFWSKGQDTYFNVRRVFHPNAYIYASKPLPALFGDHEQAKEKEY